MLTHYASNERNDQHPLRAYVYVTSRRNRSNIYPKRYLNFVSLFFHHSSHSIFVSQLLTLDAYLRPLAAARRGRRTLAVESRAAFFYRGRVITYFVDPFPPPIRPWPIHTVFRYTHLHRFRFFCGLSLDGSGFREKVRNLHVAASKPNA